MFGPKNCCAEKNVKHENNVIKNGLRYCTTREINLFYVVFSVYVVIGDPLEYVGLMSYLDYKGLLDSGTYFVVGVHASSYSINNDPEIYIKGTARLGKTSMNKFSKFCICSNRIKTNLNILKVSAAILY